MSDLFHTIAEALRPDMKDEKEMIAKFMDLEQDDNGYFWVNGSMRIALTLPYDSSWDWLMEVIEKISRMPTDDGEETFYLRTFGMKDINGYSMVRFNRSPLLAKPTLIEAAYLAVVEFIKWYNAQPK